MPSFNAATAGKQLPGVVAAFIVMLAGFWLADLIGQAILSAQGLTGSSPVSGVPVAIVLGLLLRNTLPLPASLSPGLKFATTTVLRAGIVLVGIRLSLFDVLKLGLAGL
ncbi:MAG: putative sulfate exporter family transporter, partial [Vicinamibacterales bacterium]